ncbi:MAG: TPM domain-containing protein [Candidatus Omnitrophica bacterium]|nr:TPM domain-containing protein [Candidatus Omnitrophota bacterium]
MKKFFVILFASLILFLPGTLALADNIPEPQGWVNDFAGVLAPRDIQKISDAIQKVEQQTTTEIAVVTVVSIAPYDEAGYARLVFDKWKPGKKGKDNGVLILLAVKERRWRIETGYGVESVLPDGVCGEIGRNYMVPDFKAGNYGEGLYQGVLKIAGIISGEINPGSVATNTGHVDKGTMKLVGYLAGFIFVFTPWKANLALIVVAVIALFVLRKLIFLPVILFMFVLVFFMRVFRKKGGGGFGFNTAGGFSGGVGLGGGGFGGGGFGGGGFGGFGGGGGGGGGSGGGF